MACPLRFLIAGVSVLVAFWLALRTHWAPEEHGRQVAEHGSKVSSSFSLRPGIHECSRSAMHTFAPEPCTSDA